MRELVAKNYRLLVWSLFGLLLVLCVPFSWKSVDSLSGGIFFLSQGIHEIDPLTDYLVGWLYAAIVFALIFLLPINNLHKKWLVRFWLVRCVVTLILMLLYEGFFHLDATAYFFESRFAEFRWPVSLKDNWSILSYIAWWLNHNLLISDSYHALKVLFSTLGLLGSYFLYLGVRSHVGRESQSIFYLFQLIPSMLFWSSILGKDPLNFFGICLYAYGVLSWIAPEKESSRFFRSITSVLLGIFCCYIIRPWVVHVLVAPLLLLLVVRIPIRPLRWLCIAFTPFVFAYLGTQVMGSMGLESTQDLVKATSAVSRSWAVGGSAQEVPEFKSVGDLLRFAPIGMFAALFRPLPGEILNPFGLLAGIENTFLLFLVARGTRRKWRNWEETPENEKTLLIWALATILGWSFLYAFISYQNLGSAFRFRLQILPMLLLYVYFTNKQVSYNPLASFAPKNDGSQDYASDTSNETNR